MISSGASLYDLCRPLFGGGIVGRVVDQAPIQEFAEDRLPADLEAIGNPGGSGLRYIACEGPIEGLVGYQKAGG